MNTSGTPAWQPLAEQPLDALDGEILDRIARLYTELDPVPDELVERLRFAISLDALEFELAELSQDSAELAGARADEASPIESLTFTSGSLSTMLTISSDGPERVRIDGWLAPAAAAVVELHQGSRVLRTDADADGRFVFADVEHGLSRFAIRGRVSNAAPVITPAVEI